MHIKQLVDDATVSWWVVVVISMPITLIVLVTLAIGLKKFEGLKRGSQTGKDTSDCQTGD
jgi:ABC-type transport system involved in cytochrome c biogenesis permease subunit